MNVGILVLFVNSFGIREYYNAQEIGMAKAFADEGHRVTIYKCAAPDKERVDEQIWPNVRYVFQPVKKFGSNAISDFEWLDKDLDLLVCFSDIQLFVSRAYKWAARNGVAFAPYVGTIKSSGRKMIKHISNLCAVRVIHFYRGQHVFAKTNAVKRDLEAKDIRNVTVAPVGLDITKLRSSISREDARHELNIRQDAKYLLLVGRIEPDRRPLDAVDVLERVHTVCPEYRLLIVGKGSQKELLMDKLKEKGLLDYADYAGALLNADMWKAYRAAECLVSFSRHEIFGMSILEAMYYETVPYVLHAPGPDDIIEDGVNGFLFHTLDEMAAGIVREKDDEALGKAAHERIMKDFLWSKAVSIIEDNITKE